MRPTMPWAPSEGMTTMSEPNGSDLSMTLVAQLAHDVIVVAQDEIDALLAVGRAIDDGHIEGLHGPDDVVSISCSMHDPIDGTLVDFGRVIDLRRAVASQPEFVMGDVAPDGCRQWIVTLSGSVTRTFAADRMRTMTSLRLACGRLLSEPTVQSDIEGVQCDIRVLDHVCPVGIANH